MNWPTLRFSLMTLRASSLSEMRAKARRLKQSQGKLDLLIVDYLQLMSGGRPALREPHAGSLGDLARVEGAGQGVECAGDCAFAVEPRAGEPGRRSSSATGGSARVWVDRARCRRRGFHLPRRGLQAGRSRLAGQGGTHYCQAAQRADGQGSSLAFIKNSTRFESMVSDGMAPPE